jgi:hypothetical protein
MNDNDDNNNRDDNDDDNNRDDNIDNNDVINFVQYINTFDYGYGFTSTINDSLVLHKKLSENLVLIQYSARIKDDVKTTMIKENKYLNKQDIENLQVSAFTGRWEPLHGIVEPKIVSRVREFQHRNIQRILHSAIMANNDRYDFHTPIVQPLTDTLSQPIALRLAPEKVISQSTYPTYPTKSINQILTYEHLLTIMIDIASGLNHLYSCGIYYIYHVNINKIGIQVNEDGNPYDSDDTHAILCYIHLDGMMINHESEKHVVARSKKKFSDICGMLNIILSLYSGFNLKFPIILDDDDIDDIDDSKEEFGNEAAILDNINDGKTADNNDANAVNVNVADEVEDDLPDISGLLSMLPDVKINDGKPQFPKFSNLQYNTVPVEMSIGLEDQTKSIILDLKDQHPPLYALFHNICLKRFTHQPEYTMIELHNEFVTLYTNLKREQGYTIILINTTLLLSDLCELILKYCFVRYNNKLS